MQRENEVQHVFLVGAKSLGAYGGYETFVYKLTEYHQNKKNIKYHVACKANGDGCMDETKVEGVTRINDHEFEFHNAHCFKIDIPQIGAAQAIYYDVAALNACCKYIKEHKIKNPIVYIMACRIGPFAAHFYKEIHKLGGTVYLNPDGHEWMRAKWSAPIRKYWKVSEQMMVKYCDLAICDSVNIEKYIHECYDGKGIKGNNPKTTFIAYGADLTLSKLADDDEKLVNWYKEKGLTKKGYYLVVGRFVPENSFEVMIREFMKSKSKKDFAIITNVNDKFLNALKKEMIRVIQGTSGLDREMIQQMVNENKEALLIAQTNLADAEKKLKEIEEQNQKAERNCSDLFTWASTYKGASFERRQAILKQFIKEVRVGRDYNIEIVLNVPLDEFEEFKRHAATAGRGKNQKNKSQNPQKVGRCTSNAGIVVLDKTAGETISIVPKNAAHAILRC